MLCVRVLSDAVVFDVIVCVLVSKVVSVIILCLCMCLYVRESC